MDRFHVRRGARNLQTEHASLLGVMQHLGAVEQRLRRHAAPQDAESAERLRAVDDRDLFAQPGGDASSIEARTATSDGDEVVALHPARRSLRRSRAKVLDLRSTGNRQW